MSYQVFGDYKSESTARDKAKRLKTLGRCRHATVHKIKGKKNRWEVHALGYK